MPKNGSAALLLTTTMFGVANCRSRTSEALRRSMSLLDSAVMASGTSCSDWSRFCAVTTISSMPCWASACCAKTCAAGASDAVVTETISAARTFAPSTLLIREFFICPPVANASCALPWGKA